MKEIVLNKEIYTDDMAKLFMVEQYPTNELCDVYVFDGAENGPWFEKVFTNIHYPTFTSHLNTDRPDHYGVYLGLIHGLYDCKDGWVSPKQDSLSLADFWELYRTEQKNIPETIGEGARYKRMRERDEYVLNRVRELISYAR